MPRTAEIIIVTGIESLKANIPSAAIPPMMSAGRLTTPEGT